MTTSRPCENNYTKLKGLVVEFKVYPQLIIYQLITSKSSDVRAISFQVIGYYNSSGSNSTKHILILGTGYYFMAWKESKEVGSIFFFFLIPRIKYKLSWNLMSWFLMSWPVRSLMTWISDELDKVELIYDDLGWNSIMNVYFWNISPANALSHRGVTVCGGKLNIITVFLTLFLYLSEAWYFNFQICNPRPKWSVQAV